MTIPTAVSPSVKTPGLYLTVNLLAGAASPGSGALRIALLAPKSSSGDLTVDTEVRAGSGVDGAKTAFGQGAPGHLMAKIIYGKYPQAQVDFVAPTAGAGSATLTVTAAGTPTSNQVVDCDIMGRTFEVEWLSGVAHTAFIPLLVAAIVARADDLMVTAADGEGGDCDITSVVTGNIGNDVLVKIKLRYAQTGTEALTGALVHTNLAGGSADPDFATALASIAGREYHYILPALSNTDIEQIATDNGLQDVLSHIDTYDDGLNAKLQQVVTGHTGAIADAVATAADANGGNDDGRAQILCCVNGRSLPCEFAAREMVGRLASVSVDPAGNRIGELLDMVVGSWDVVADRPTAAECETALNGGVSIVTYTDIGDAEQLTRPVTCHGSDNRLLDVQNVDGTYIVARDIRDSLPQAFPNAKITADIEEGDEPPPAGVLEIRDVKAWVINRLYAWVRKGVVQKAALAAAIADGSLVVEINSSDSTQVDMVLPYKIVQPWAKTGVVAQRIPE
jgi:phage tail sheath gpL-like